MANSTLVTDYLGNGLAASRPSAPAIPSGGLAFYYATDTGVLSVWNPSGPGWINVPLTSAMLDTLFGSTQGSIIYRGASTWQALAPGTSGEVLVCGGTGGNPSWGSGSSGGASYSPPNTSTFAWTSQPTGATQTNITGALQIFCQSNGGSRDMAFLSIAAPSTPYTYWERQSLLPQGANYYSTGIAFGDGSGKIIRHGTAMNNSLNVQIDEYTNPTTFSSTPYAQPGTGGQIVVPPLYGIKDDGTNLYFMISYDGVSLFTVYQASRTAFFASGPTKIGLAMDAISENMYMNVAHWATTLPGPI